MVAEPPPQPHQQWLIKMGNQVTSNLKHTFLLKPTSKEAPKTQTHKQLIGILSFEVANVLSKTIHLHKSLTDTELTKLKTQTLKSQGVINLVSTDESYLLDLVLAERLDELNRVSAIISRLGKKCVQPALLGFEHVYGDIVNGVIDVKELGFLVKDMDGMVKKMERYVNATANLYSELEVLGELEHAAKKFQNSQHEESRRAFEQKVIWQKQDVRHLKEISLWNQSYDKIVELLVRSVCTIFARICVVFGDYVRRESIGLIWGGLHSMKGENGQMDDLSVVSGQVSRVGSMSSNRTGTVSMPCILQPKNKVSSHRVEDFHFKCGMSPGRLLMDCLSLSSSASKLDGDDEYTQQHDDRCSQISGFCSVATGSLRRERRKSGFSSARVAPKSRLSVYTSNLTVGGSALSLHYANIIIVIEKLLHYPHLVGEEARDDLYQMLPISLRNSLKTNLKSYVMNLAIYDAPLAHGWKENLDGILKWLAPLAHNMIRWQSERNFEQTQIISRTNVLLLETLYFADREKTEAAICELLVGLNYLCRYEHQQNALLDCASSFDFDDCVQWQRQCEPTDVARL
ncbi:hypothetical protein ACFE04_014485 [Oxalis oulophora]